MPSPAPVRAVAVVLAALAVTALTGCIANPPNAAAPATPVPTEVPGPAPTPAVEAPPAWGACARAVEEQYPDEATADDLVPYEQGDVRDGESGGAVVDLAFGEGLDGEPVAAFTCSVSGTPEAPVVDGVQPATS
ncbi:hypothetical protein [Frigoribacterium salinisoli]